MLESLLAFFPARATIHVDLIGDLRTKLLAQEAISFSAAVLEIALNGLPVGLRLRLYPQQY